MARVDPGELILSDRLWERADIGGSLEGWGGLPTPLPGARFDSVSGRRRLEAHYGVRSLDAFGAFSRAEIAACGAALDYVALTQQGRLPRIDPPRRLGPGTAMEIDAATRRNLEITRSLSGERQGSLLAVIDLTVTGAGARSLAERLGAPSTDCETIAHRLDAVEHFVSDEMLRSRCREILAACPDLQRATTRLALGRGGPRDLAALGESLSRARDLSGSIGGGAAAAPEGGRARGGGPRGTRRDDRGSRRGARAGPSPACAGRGLRGGGVRRGARRAPRTSRRQPPADRRSSEAVCRRDRHRLAQDSPQQRARLFRRSDADPRGGDVGPRGLHSSPDAGQCAALHHGRARRARGEARHRLRQGSGPGARHLRGASPTG